MQVSYPNEVKIYNLSAGKSLPEWLSDRRRRKLQQSDADIGKRVELIQDFEMPDVSTAVSVSHDEQYIMAAGTYKPRLRCYDVNELSLKFERCLDADVIKMVILSEGYEKMLFLEDDRWIELHTQNGHYFRTRVPSFGRDMLYVPSTCDVYVVGASPEIFRLNLELGRFVIPLSTTAKENNCCALNDSHHLVVVGSNEGFVDALDPRSKETVGRLNCKCPELDSATIRSKSEKPSVSSVSFKDSLTLAVGMSSGQILLYDIRAQRPLLVKDHFYDLPIKCIDLLGNHVFSMDSRCIKIWDVHSGQPYTSIEPGTSLNHLCLMPKKDSGLFFVANEAPKLLTYYIPSLGPAPKWCSFLDNITEELEESNELSVYDDYKFLTVQELNDLGLDHLIGTNMLRAYMHGYFADIRLYQKALALTDPFAYDKYRKKKIQDKLSDERKSRIEMEKKKTVDPGLENVKQDARFSAMFQNPDFEIDEESEEFHLRKPAQAREKANEIRSAARKSNFNRSERSGKMSAKYSTAHSSKVPQEPDKKKLQLKGLKVFDFEDQEQYQRVSSVILNPKAAERQQADRHESLNTRLQSTRLDSSTH